MKQLSVNIFREGDEIICLLGQDSQEGITGTGKTVLEALMDFSSNIEAALHQNYYCSEDLIEQITDLNHAVEEIEHPDSLDEEI